MTTNRILPRALAWALLLLLPALASAGETPVTPLKAKVPYLLGAGDVLRVVVWKNSDLTGEFLVRPDGQITLPLAGEIQASGETTEAVGRQIETRLKDFIESPMVTVIVLQASSNQVFILGQVARPGAYPLPGPFNFLQALAVAGGFTPYADRNGIILLRQSGDRQVRTILRFDDVVKGSGAEGSIPLNRGDTIIVP